MKNPPKELLDYLKELGFTFTKLGISVLNLADIGEVERALKDWRSEDYARGKMEGIQQGKDY